MKKVLALMLALVMILSLGTVVFAAETNSVAGKPTAAELKIAKAYLKTVEESDGKYIQKYAYPGSKFELEPADESVTMKVLDPVFTKVKDEETRLTRIDFSGYLVASSTEELIVMDLQKGIVLKTKAKKLYAYTDVVVRAETVENLAELDEDTYGAIFDYLTELYDEDIATSLMDNYGPPADEEGTGEVDKEDGSVEGGTR